MKTLTTDPWNKLRIVSTIRSARNQLLDAIDLIEGDQWGDATDDIDGAIERLTVACGQVEKRTEVTS